MTQTMTPTVGVLPDTFGARLRQLRRRAGLSQTETGGERYSGSYVSYLESGRRRPTADVVDFLAGRLGVAVSDLADRSHSEPGASGEVDLMEAESGIREAQRSDDQSLVRDRAEHTADLALAHHRPDIWWQATLCRVRAEMALGHFELAAELGRSLVAHPISRGSAVLRSELLTLLARCSRALSSLEDSLEFSERAVQAAHECGEEMPDALAQALLAHVASLSAVGRTDEVGESAGELKQVRGRIRSPQVSGTISWTLGNVAYLSGDAETGATEYAAALELLQPDVDLQMWARVRQSSARMQLEYGRLEGVSGLIDAAAMAISWVGNAGDRANLETVRGLFAAAHGRHREAMLLYDGVLGADCPLSWASRGEVRELQHRSLLALGDVAGARTHLRLAAEEYEKAHALGSAVAMWRAYARLESDRGGPALRGDRRSGVASPSSPSWFGEPGSPSSAG